MKTRTPCEANDIDAKVGKAAFFLHYDMENYSETHGLELSMKPPEVWPLNHKRISCDMPKKGGDDTGLITAEKGVKICKIHKDGLVNSI